MIDHWAAGAQSISRPALTANYNPDSSKFPSRPTIHLPMLLWYASSAFSDGSMTVIAFSEQTAKN